MFRIFGLGWPWKDLVIIFKFSDDFDALIRCVQDVAGLCALKNDDYENVKNGRIREKVENFIEKDLDLYNVSI